MMELELYLEHDVCGPVVDCEPDVGHLLVVEHPVDPFVPRLLLTLTTTRRAQVVVGPLHRVEASLPNPEGGRLLAHLPVDREAVPVHNGLHLLKQADC